PSVTDNCSDNVGVTYSHQPGSIFPAGTTEITVTASDEAGNESICTFNVIVTDNEAPVMNCPLDIVVSMDENSCTAIAEFEATATDNCPGNVALTYSHASGSRFPAGTTLVAVTATDAAGNSTECTFSVTVTDEEAPALMCHENIEVTMDE